MWAELFLENKDFTLYELDTYIESLNTYRDAIARGDRETLTALLEEGKRRKEEVDG
jgi:prephenate dehydrogenase